MPLLLHFILPIPLLLPQLHYCSQDLVDICSNCNKAFSKERDKSHVIRAVIAKFIEALKYKTSIPDVNFLYLGSMMLQVMVVVVRIMVMSILMMASLQGWRCCG